MVPTQFPAGFTRSSMRTGAGTRFNPRLQQLWSHAFWVVLLLMFTWSSVVPVSAQTVTPSSAPAGSIIGNQASATFSDDSGVTRTVVSNVVQSTVQQVAAVDLGPATQTVVDTPGDQTRFPHTITNTGNGADIFNLTAVNAGGDAFNLTNVQIFADANSDGLPDNNTPITTTPTLQPGEVFTFIVVGTTPTTATSGQTAIVTVTATSQFNTQIRDTATDTITVTTNADIEITKAISPTTTGGPNSGPYTVTLTYNNVGSRTATNLRITDLLPAGMIYVPQSGRWSVSGGTILTDAAGGDPAGITYDFGATTPNQVTAVIASVPANTTGQLTFQVRIGSNVPPSEIANVANFTYLDGSGSTTPVTGRSNTAVFTVTQTAAVTYNGDTEATASQGGTVVFTNPLTNTGNGTDTFNVRVNTATSTFPPGTTFQLFHPDGVTPLVDTNGDAIPDTGPLAPGETYNVIIRAVLPTNAGGGGPFTVSSTATSVTTPTVTATAVDTLTTIARATVDLTNGTGLGVGAGPEPAPVITRTVDPGSVARFPLVINNTSGIPDSYTLSVTTLNGQPLPAGFTVVFRDAATGNIVTNTGTIPAGGSGSFIAEVTVAGGTGPQDLDLLFRASSASTGASDTIFDRVSVNTVRGLDITPDAQTSTTFAGVPVVYTHTITNTGNIAEGGGTLSTVALTATNSEQGFTSLIFFDANGNGVLDATDPQITNLSQVNVGGNSGLDAGESAMIFVQVTPAPNAPLGVTNVTTLTATATNVTATGTPPSDTARDTTTLTGGQLRIVKEQAIDATCDGTPDAAYQQGTLTTGIVPGACIRYRITVTNTGTSPARSIVVNDAIPSFTFYDDGNAALSATGRAAFTLNGTSFIAAATTPANGANGTLTFNIGTLNPGQTATIYFGVKVR